MRKGLALAAGIVLFTAVLALRISGQTPAVPTGDPLTGITPAEFERFRLGLEDFLEVETAEEGLGPAFNGTSCAVCHSVPAIGGGGLISEVRAGIREPSGAFKPIVTIEGSDGDTLFQVFSIPGHACQPVLPVEINVIARRIPIPLFGAGLVEVIPDADIEALEDPNDRNHDGISGRVARVRDRPSGQSRVGRFGWKAQQATLRAFAGDAYRNEMGITNDIFPDELAIGIPADRMRLCDRIPDPEDKRDRRTGLTGVDNFEAFMKFLAPLGRGATTDVTAFGAQIFESVGCAGCHVPLLRTGPSTNPLFDRRPVAAFSDFLLHDVGTGDGIGQEAAQPNEIRTPALWGLRFRRLLLHDGSASTLLEAIERHGQEAQKSRDTFLGVSGSGRTALLTFLASL